MMNYILRSAGERKRLHILAFPRSVPPSSDTIALRGGYSSEKFVDWHKSKLKAETEIKLKCLVNNIVMSSLINWWWDFRDISLVRFKGIRPFAESTGYWHDYQTFLKILEMQNMKSKALIKDIWHRGSILLMKRFKYLKKRNTQKLKWTFKGPFSLDSENQTVKSCIN